jgi:hypothetical protein
MELMEKLNENNFILYCMHNYDNPQCHSIEEFEEDLKRFLYLRKLLSRYKRNGELKERLILNHIIVLYNVFGEATLNLLLYKVEEELWDSLVTFLVYLDRMPEEVPTHSLILSDIVLDENIISALRKI